MSKQVLVRLGQGSAAQNTNQRALIHLCPKVVRVCAEWAPKAPQTWASAAGSSYKQDPAEEKPPAVTGSRPKSKGALPPAPTLVYPN